jgi:sugar-specific transcriptional regulator TrmB
MAQDQLSKALSEAFSLTEKEQQIFLRLRDVGKQSASLVARYCEIPRSTVRGILDNLVRRGLLTRSRRSNTQFYSVEKSSALLTFLKNRKENLGAEIDLQIKLVENNREAFDKSDAQGARPQISFYDGYEGLKKVYEDTLTAKSEIRAWASFDANKEALPRYFESYYTRRAKRQLWIRGIHADTPYSKLVTKNNKKYFRKTIPVPPEKFAIGPEIQIYDNKVNIASWKDKLGIIIESDQIAATLKAIFDLNYETLARIYSEKK